MPDTPTRSLGYHAAWQVDGKKPQTMQWTVIRKSSYFYVEILRFPLETDLSHDGLEEVLAALKTENSKRYVYGDKSISLEGRSGRVQYTRPIHDTGICRWQGYLHFRYRWIRRHRYEEILRFIPLHR